MAASHHRTFVAEAYRAHGASVLRRARQILADDAEAHDVTQEVFVDLLDRPRFAGRSALLTYLYSATTHMCLNRLRNRRTRERLRAERAEALEPTSDPAAPDVVAALRQLLAGLDDDEARAAIHHYLDGMSHAEIAPLLDCSRRRVGDLLDRLATRLTRVERQEVG